VRGRVEYCIGSALCLAGMAMLKVETWNG
jgi:hypothetical protein